MRITIVTNDPPESPRGGTAVIVKRHAELCRSLGHDVTILTPPSDAWRQSSAVSRLFFHLQDLRASSVMMQRIEETQPEILITENVTGCGWGTARRFRERGVRWIHVLHDVAMFEPSGKVVFGESVPWLRFVWRRLWATLRSRAFGNPDVVVSPTEWLLQVHRAFGLFVLTSSRVIPNPVSSAPMMEIEKERHVLFVGRCDADKGIQDVCEAWHQMPDGWSLRVFGAGSLRESLSRQTPPTVHWFGSVSPERVLTEMCRAMVIVVPSRVAENQPTVIVDALACGVRVVATGVGGIPETLGDAGVIVPPADPMALRQAILAMMSSDARPMLPNRYRPEVVAEAWTGLLKSNR